MPVGVPRVRLFSPQHLPWLSCWPCVDRPGTRRQRPIPRDHYQQSAHQRHQLPRLLDIQLRAIDLSPTLVLKLQNPGKFYFHCGLRRHANESLKPHQRTRSKREPSEFLSAGQGASTLNGPCHWSITSWLRQPSRRRLCCLHHLAPQPLPCRPWLVRQKRPCLRPASSHLL